MALTITAADVRGRLQLTSDELSDATLATASFIPAGQAFINKKLSGVGLDYDSLAAGDKPLAYAAGVALIAGRVLIQAARGRMNVGKLSIDDPSPSGMAKYAQELQKEASEFLAMLGCVSDGGFYVQGSGHETYEQPFVESE